MKPHLHKVPSGWQVWDSRENHRRWANAREYEVIYYEDFPVTPPRKRAIVAFWEYHQHRKRYPLEQP